MDTFFAGGFVRARPFESFHIDFCHLFGFEHNVIDSRRRCEHILIVEFDGDVAPCALNEVFVKKSYACVFDVLCDFLFLVGDDCGRFFFFLFLFTALGSLLLFLVGFGIFEFEYDVFQKCGDYAHMLRSALLFRKNFGVASLVQNERCGENFVESTSRHDRARFGKQAAVALTRKSRNHVGSDVLLRAFD